MMKIRLYQPQNSAEIDAIDFIIKAHEGVLYGDRPYHEHPMEVAQVIEDYNLDEETRIAALLHDVIEDTKHTKHELAVLFGYTIAEVVDGASMVSQGMDANRKTRKLADHEHFESGDSRVHNVKLADTNKNISTVIEGKPRSAKDYTREKIDLVPRLVKGDPKLYKDTVDVVNAVAEKLGIKERIPTF